MRLLCWDMLVISAGRRLRQEDAAFKASLGCIVRCFVGVMVQVVEPCLATMRPSVQTTVPLKQTNKPHTHTHTP
jgi:hypothetical protein